MALWNNKTNPFQSPHGVYPYSWNLQCDFLNTHSGIVNRNLEEGQKDCRWNYNQSTKTMGTIKEPSRTYQEGDKVWLEGCNLHLDHPSIKLSTIDPSRLQGSYLLPLINWNCQLNGRFMTYFTLIFSPPIVMTRKDRPIFLFLLLPSASSPLFPILDYPIVTHSHWHTMYPYDSS